MKHPASTSAVLLLGLAFLVGGATWLLSGSDADDGAVAQVPVATASSTVGFKAVTPKEHQKQLNMERTQREFKRIREIGQEVGPELYMIPDANGDPTYYSTELIKGRGRNGEPLFLSAQFKKTRTMPLRDPKKYIAPEAPKFKAKPLPGLIKSGPAESGEGGDETPPTGIGATGGDGGSAGAGKSPGG